MSFLPLVDILALLAVGLGSVIDLISHRIPNKLTVSTILGALALQSALNGWPGLLDSTLGILVMFSFFLPFYKCRWMGAGDVKLLMAVGGCLGWRLGILAGLSTLLIGAMVAFMFMLVHGDLLTYLRRYGVMAKCLFLTGHFAYVPPESGESANKRFPYALAIALGTLSAIYGPTHWSFMRIPILSGS